MSAISWPHNVPLTLTRLRDVMHDHAFRMQGRAEYLVLTEPQRHELLRATDFLDDYDHGPAIGRGGRGDEFIYGMRVIVPEEARPPMRFATTPRGPTEFYDFASDMLDFRTLPDYASLTIGDWGATPAPRQPVTSHSSWSSE